MKFLILVSLWVTATLAEEIHLLKDFSVGNTKFTADVYKELVKSNSGSFVVCPLSVDMVLALLHIGAKGATARQISDGLHLPEDGEKIKQIFSKLSSSLKSNDRYDLSNANKLYVRNGFQISDQFKTSAVNVFSADIQNIDFQNREVAASEMNSWVEQKTHDKIKNSVSPDDLGNDIDSVIINALYFRGNWVTQFRPEATRNRPFHLNNNNQVQVEMMEMADEFNGYESSELDAKFLEMPYEGGDVTMTFVLPNEIEGLSRLENRISEVLVAPEYHFGRAHVMIPKYKAESTIQFKPILQALGVVEPFENTADFSGIGVNQEKLSISKIIQKSFIEVEEKGTTAAAGTVGFIRYLSASYVPPPVLQFVADHPFLYYIKVKGIVLFVGRYIGP